MTEKQTESLCSHLENVEYDIVELETALTNTGFKTLSKEIKSYHNEFIKLIKKIEKVIE